MQRIRALGFDEQGHTPDVPEKVQGGTRYQGRMIENERFYDSWIALNEHIQKVGVKLVYEEAAYTWFNRLVAIRIMQKNNFIEPVLSYDNLEIRVPHIVSEARRGHIMCTLTTDEQNRLRSLLMDDTKTQEQFALLIIAYCRENAVISKCFGGIAQYLELLLPDDILSQNRFIDFLNNTNEYITDDQFKSAELIGWLYQFYISEKKDEVFASFKNGRKAEAEDIPAATQIFTPNWIVKYMVQNTVGRIYLDNNPYCPLKKDWKYLVEPTEKTPKETILNIDNLEDLTLADLACGSGHILVEGFDILYSLYIDEGYSRYDAIKNIFTKNLTGIDLDTRAKQLATFALLLKAAQIDPTFLNGEIMPRVYDMPKVDRYTWRDLNGHMTCALQIQGPNKDVSEEIDDCFTLMEQANNLGSIMKFNISDATRDFIKKCVDEQNRQYKFENQFADLFHGFHIILALTEKYAALAANPPYMGNGNMNEGLKKYLVKYYNDSKSDLYAVFIQKMLWSLHKKGVMGCITMESWMFLSSFEMFRHFIIEGYTIESLIHMPYLGKGWTPMGISFGTAACVLNNQIKDIIANYQYIRYYETAKERGVPLVFPTINERYSNISQKYFKNIPGWTVGYWVSKHFIDNFSCNKIDNYSEVITGMTIGDNVRYLRLWYEIDFQRFVSNSKTMSDVNIFLTPWIPYSKGGVRRQWYGNYEYVVNWSKKDNFNRAKTTLSHLYLREALTWPFITTGKFSCRYLPSGSLWDVAGSPCFFEKTSNMFYTLGFLGSIVARYILSVVNPTINVQAVDIKNLPLIISNDKEIINYVQSNISISRQDWDAHETSWDFEENPLLHCNDAEIEEEGEIADLGVAPGPLKLQYEHYKAEWTQMFKQLHANEEELNRQFIEIYGLQDELTPDVPLDEITILQQGEISIEDNQIKWHADVVMKQLISYAIGCMMGRYRLDKKGLCIAHPNPSAEEIAPYPYHEGTFEIDDDGIIPLMAKDSRFDDNGVNRLTDFVKLVFGEEALTDNMNFLEEQLGKSVEQYLIKDFWKDHKKMYQNRPIYWLFSSKKGAFQVIAYMHRMNKYTVENIRNKYLLPHIEYLRQELAGLDARITALTPQERKQYQKLQKDLEECMEYHDRLHSVADQQIDFDLDDGVVVNYAKFGDVLAKLK